MQATLSKPRRWRWSEDEGGERASGGDHYQHRGCRGEAEAAAAKEEQLKVDSARIAVEKQEAEDDLAKAIPALEAAAEALKNLRKGGHHRDKGVRQAPAAGAEGVRVRADSQEAEGYREGRQGDARRVDFLKSLVEYEKDAITINRSRRSSAYTSTKTSTQSLSPASPRPAAVCSSGSLPSSTTTPSRAR